MRFRLFNNLYAKLNGYFWLPCPLSGQFFGGHEWSEDGVGIPIVGKGNWLTGTSTGVCPDCAPVVIVIRRLVQRGLLSSEYMPKTA
jgi:hypothetical protein